MTIVGRQKVDNPALGTDGGPSLKTAIDALYKILSDNYVLKYAEFTSVADSATVEIDHNFGASLGELEVLIYSGTGATKTLINDPRGTPGYAWNAKVGDLLTILEVDAPSSGGPHDFTVAVIDARVVTQQTMQVLAAAPDNPAANTLKSWVDSNVQPLTLNSAGVSQPGNFLSNVYVSATGNAVPGQNHLVRSNSGAYTLTLPSTITGYAVAMFSDAGRNANTNNITLGRNGNTINGVAADYVMSEDGGWLILLGDPINNDWILLASSQASSSESGINYFENGNFENSFTLGVSASGSVSPTIGEETAAPLWGTRSSKITSGAGTGIIDYNIGPAGNLIDNAVVDSSILTLVTAYIKTDSNAAEGDWTVGVYDSVGAAYITGPTNLKADTLNIHRVPFQPGFTTVDRYKLRIEFTDTTAGRVLVVDKLKVTPDSNSGLIDPAPEFYQRQKGGNGHGSTNTNIRRFAAIDSSYDNLGTAISLDSNEAVNGQSFTINEAGIYHISYIDGHLTTAPAYGLSLNSSELTTGPGSISENDLIAISNGTLSGGGFDSISITRFFDVGDVIRAHTDGNLNRTSNNQVMFTITQVQRFTDKVNLLTQDTITSNSSLIARVSSNISSYVADTPIVFDATDDKVGTGFSHNQGTGEVTCNFNGRISFNLMIRGSTWSNGDLKLYVNGAAALLGVNPLDGGLSTTDWGGGLKVSNGDVLTWRHGGNISTIIGGALNSTSTWVYVERIPDYGAFDPVSFAEATTEQLGLVNKNNIIQASDASTYTSAQTDRAQTTGIADGVYRVSVFINRIRPVIDTENRDCYVFPRLNNADIPVVGSTRWRVGYYTTIAGSGSTLTGMPLSGLTSTQIITFSGGSNTFDLDIAIDTTGSIEGISYVLEKLENTSL